MKRDIEYLIVLLSMRLANRGRRVARELALIPDPSSRMQTMVRGLMVSGLLLIRDTVQD